MGLANCHWYSGYLCTPVTSFRLHAQATTNPCTLAPRLQHFIVGVAHTSHSQRRLEKKLYREYLRNRLEEVKVLGVQIRPGTPRKSTIPSASTSTQPFTRESAEQRRQAFPTPHPRQSREAAVTSSTSPKPNPRGGSLAVT